MRPLFGLVVFLLGCGGVPSVSPSSDASPLAALERDTGQRWTVRWQPDLPTPAFLEGRTAPMALTAQAAGKAGRAFIFEYGALFGLGSDDALVLESAATDELGMSHAAFTQRRGTIPVWGGELRVHFAADGALVRVNGRSIPVSAISLVPARGSIQARSAATLDAWALLPRVDHDSFTSLEPSLGIFDSRLAWRVRIEVHDARQPRVFDSFIDAEAGSILARVDVARSLEGSGVGVFGDRQALSITHKDGHYWLEDPSRGGQKTYSAEGRAHLPGTGVRSDDPNRWDQAGGAAGAAVDAHAFVARSWDYFHDVHGRAGWDGSGAAVHATVHFGSSFAGAFFDGRQLVFGDGSRELWPPSGALDVVAHEFTHGVSFATAQLMASGESGELDEAIADLFACFISGDWQIAETLYRPLGVAGALRDLAHPHLTGNPETMDEYRAVDDLHFNSTIVSHAGWWMSEVGGLGMEATARIWYRALERYLTSQARFADAADATIAAARDFGRGEEGAVRAAWVAAGILNE